MKKRFLTVLIVFLAAFSLQSFSASNSMTEDTAHNLALSFFQKEYGVLTAGGVSGAIDHGKSWEFQPYVGVEAKPTFRKIRVSKKDGKAYFAYSFGNAIKVLFP